LTVLVRLVDGEGGGSQSSEVERPDHVQLEIGQEDFLRDRRAVCVDEARASDHDAGGADGDREGPERTSRRDRRSDRLVVVDVAADSPHAVSELLFEHGGSLAVRVQHDDADTEVGEVTDGRAAESPGPSGDHGRTAFEAHHPGAATACTAATSPGPRK